MWGKVPLSSFKGNTKSYVRDKTPSATSGHIAILEVSLPSLIHAVSFTFIPLMAIVSSSMFISM
jgi:hypothetical protein